MIATKIRQNFIILLNVFRRSLAGFNILRISHKGTVEKQKPECTSLLVRFFQKSK
jgi:hypothetical protein